MRWASYGDQGSDVPGGPNGTLRRRPTTTSPAPFGFSYVVAKEGHLIYADVHSDLYVLKRTGPWRHEIPSRGNCLSGNRGSLSPWYEPCAPYGRSDDPRNS